MGLAQTPAATRRTVLVTAWIAILACAVRLALLAVWVNSHSDFYRLGGEIGRVALSLIRTGQFADPYMIPTGPTAHPAPVTPALLALIYGTMGLNAGAGYVRAFLGIISSSLLCGLLPWVARRLGLGARAGVCAGVAMALIPRFGSEEFLGTGATAQASIAFALLTVAFLGRWTADRLPAAGSLALGAACGAAFHLLPPLLVVVAACLGFEAWWRRGRGGWLPAACVMAAAALVCLPWTLRNHRTLDAWLFIRGNFGLELRIANQPGADADIEVTLARAGTLRHPSENLAEAQKVKQLGEAEYNRQAKQEALQWIGGHPGEFARLTLLRALHFWCGPLRTPWQAALTTSLTILALFGLRRAAAKTSPPRRAALIIPLATFPLVYYLVSYVAHYPLPLAWLLYLLAGFEFCHWIDAKESDEALPANSSTSC